jgi:hypothetical protein
VRSRDSSAVVVLCYCSLLSLLLLLIDAVMSYSVILHLLCCQGRKLEQIVNVSTFLKSVGKAKRKGRGGGG